MNDAMLHEQRADRGKQCNDERARPKHQPRHRSLDSRYSVCNICGIIVVEAKRPTPKDKIEHIRNGEVPYFEETKVDHRVGMAQLPKDGQRVRQAYADDKIARRSMESQTSRRSGRDRAATSSAPEPRAIRAMPTPSTRSLPSGAHGFFALLQTRVDPARSGWSGIGRLRPIGMLMKKTQRQFVIVRNPATQDRDPIAGAVTMATV